MYIQWLFIIVNAFVSGCVLQPEDKKDDSSDEPTAEVHNSITVVNIP